MKIIAALVSRNEELCASFTALKAQAFPSDALSRSVYKGKRVEVVTLGISIGLKEDEITRMLLGVGRSADCFLLFADQGSADIVEKMRGAPLVSEFDSSRIGRSLRNFINSLSGRALRSLAVILANSNDDLTRLPLRNFIAPQFIDLVNCCQGHANIQDFGEGFGSLLRDLGGRVRPRRKSSYKTRYVVDDEGKFFVYGKERHSQLETGSPHNGYCEIRGIFRFGVRIDERRHFNVSTGEGDDTSIAGHFPNCHGASQYATKTSHLNMFCNDFF